MASLESRLFYLLLRSINKKKFLQLQFSYGKFDFNTSKEPTREVYSRCKVDKRVTGGRNTFILSPKSRSSRKHILYLHGGAYVQSFVKQHWSFLSMLVEKTHCVVIAPDYPLAPMHSYRDAFDMVIPLYLDLIKREGRKNTVLMGDSAGGGFALALAQYMKLHHSEQPDQIILLSPWLDITLNNPEIKELDAMDPFLGIGGLEKAGIAYAGGDDRNVYMLSPINGPLEGLGKISVFVGSREILVADARRLKQLAGRKGVHINYREYEDMVHVWMLLNFKESRMAKTEIMNLIED